MSITVNKKDLYINDRVDILEKVLYMLLDKNPDLLSEEDFVKIKNEILSRLQDKRKLN